MQKYYFSLTILLLFLAKLYTSNTPQKLIIDTEMSLGVDEVSALTVANALSDLCEA